MAMHSKWINGNLVYYDGQRWFDAIGPTAAKFIFNSAHVPLSGADALVGATVTLVETGAGETTLTAVGGWEGGALSITTDAADNDGANIQFQEAFKFAAGKPLYFGIKLQATEATQSDFMAGLCITNTNLLGGISDGAYFRKVDGATAIKWVLEKNTTETESTETVTFANDTDVWLEITWDGANADFYVNGEQKTRLAQTNLPDDEFLAPSLQFLSGSVGAKSCTVSRWACIQIN